MTMQTQSMPFSVDTVAYGSQESQTGDLYLPKTGNAAVVCLLHGGFWRMPYGKHQMAPVAADLALRGYAVWNIEYRRVGCSGGGWPGTLHDVAGAINHLATLEHHGTGLDLDRVVIAGHSAGGQLALWAAAHNRPTSPAPPIRVRTIGVVGMAPLCDLVAAFDLNLGAGAVREFLGGPPLQMRDRCRAASPIDFLPIGTTQLILHGAKDEVLPISLSQHYAAASQACGDAVEFVRLPDAGHMDFLDIRSGAHALLCRWLAARLTSP